jgi:FtsZ-interacting cell division protein ZipA
VSELYILFLSIALLLFLAIVLYSYWQQRELEQPKKKEYVDPLFAELEGSKKPQKDADSSSLDAKINKSVLEAKGSIAESQGDKSVTSGVKKAPSVPPAGEPVREVNTTAPSLSTPVEITDSPAEQTGASGSEPVNLSDRKRDEPVVSGPPKTDASSSIVTELVARVKNPDPIEQQNLLTLFRDHDFKFHRKVHIYGLNQLTDLWRDIEFELPSARFVELGVAIQLADREGAMSKKELHDFQQMALEFSNKFDAPFEFSMDIDDAMKQAQILDQIGRRYDSMAVLNVVPRAKAGFRMADIESCARDLMMSTDKNGIFVKTKGQKHSLLSLYRLACTDGSGHFGITSGAITPVHDLVIYMNVPATPEPDRVFQEMGKDAQNLATWLDGKVVDKNGKVMTQRSYTILMQQISDIAYSMQQDGLIPGDAVSKKLF